MTEPGLAMARTGPGAGGRVVVALGDVSPGLVQGYLGEGITFIARPGPEDLAVAEGAIVRADASVDAALLARMPKLRALARTGVGVERVDVEAATERGIAVVVTPGSGTAAVAEGAVGMALSLLKRFGPLTAMVREGRWAERAAVTLGDMEGAVLGVIGFGRIGQQVASIGRALGARPMAYDPLAPPLAGASCADLYELASASDVVSLHAPLTSATRHLVDQRFLAAAKAGMVLVNCARGGLVDLDALYEAVVDGRVGGVGLDVFEPEPPAHHPLFDHPNVVLTPHLMGLSERARAATFADAARGVAEVLAGRRPAALANPSWSPPGGPRASASGAGQ